MVEYYHLDAAGNVRVVTNAAGQVIERRDYLPFGEECTTGPCAANVALGSGQPREFTGKERNPETGLDYFGARYYSSHVGRFTTTDPVTDTRYRSRSRACIRGDFYAAETKALQAAGYVRQYVRDVKVGEVVQKVYEWVRPAAEAKR